MGKRKPSFKAPTFDQLLEKEFFFTLPYYCNAPESLMREKIKKLTGKWLSLKREENRQCKVSPVVKEMIDREYNDLLIEIAGETNAVVVGKT